MDKDKLRPVEYSTIDWSAGKKESLIRRGYFLGLFSCGNNEDGTNTYAVIENLDGTTTDVSVGSFSFMDR